MSKQLNVRETPATDINVNIIGNEQQYIDHLQSVQPTDVTFLIENSSQYTPPVAGGITLNRFPSQGAFDSQTSNLTWGDVSVIYEDNDFVDKSNMFVYFYDYDGSIAYKYNIDEFFVLDKLPPLPDHSNINKICDGWNWTLQEIRNYLLEYPADIHVGCTVHCGNCPELGSSHVRFCDHEGEVLYDYTAAQFLALNALPALPDLTSINRVADGWNWTLSEISTYLKEVDGDVNVGYTMSPGNNPSAGSSVVRFIDYEGTVLYTYTAAQFLALSALPALPDRTSENLTCDGWNWTLSEITSYLNTVDGDVNVGAIYHTTDDKTHITCKPTETYTQASICLTPSTANAVTVDWDDGTTDTWTSTAQATKSHTYTGVTDSSIYDITISCSSGTYSFSTYMSGTQTDNSYNVYTDIKLSNKVTSLGTYSFQNCKFLKFINVPNTITSFSNSCFYNCSNLQSLNIPNSVTSLGNACFENCFSMKYITIPNSTSLGSSCFCSCYLLQYVTIPSSITNLGNGCFKNCYSLKSISIPSNVNSLDNNCFYNCNVLQSINIPSGVTSLGSNCFYGCYVLPVITIPSVVTSLNYTFYGCKSLQYACIPFTITTITGSCFSYCNSLKSITIPRNTTSFSNTFFRECRSLQSITLPNSITSLGNYCFYGCHSLKNIYLPNSITSLGSYCFYECTKLKTINIPRGVTNLNYNCFMLCQGLTHLSMPNTITTFGSSCFEQSTKLFSITIPSGVTSLPSNFFRDCFNVTKPITIPSTITSIGSYCFSSSAYSVFSLIMKSATPPSLGSTNAISNHNKLTIYVPTGTLSTYQSASNWSTFSSRMKEYNKLVKNTTLASSDITKDINLSNMSSYCLIDNNICVLNDTENIINDVNFYDYDGRLLYSYSSSEFLNMSSLPPLPDRTEDNLTCDGWNWTLSNIKSQINNVGGIINVGAIYHTTDDKTHITCETSTTYPTAYITLQPTVANAVIVDWGDNSTDTWTSTSRVTKTHTYTNFGIYDIIISCSSGTYSFSSYISGSSSNNSKCIYTDIKLSNKVTKLTDAFSSVYSLKYISIPNGIIIDWYAFCSCMNLKFVSIPKNVTMRQQAFDQCWNLLQACVPDNATTFEDNCFGYCYSLRSLTIPYVVETLTSTSFQECRSLKTINIPSSITSLGIVNLYSLQSISIPNGVTSLTINGCYSLQSIDIPNSVTDLRIIGCYSLQSINIPNGVTNLFINNCCSLKSITIPNTVTTFTGNSREGFANSYSLESVTIPNSATDMSSLKFNYCYSLKSITIPNTVTDWTSVSFSNCFNLKTINLPSAINSNSVYLSNCYRLQSINVPSTAINSNTFYCCHSLQSINIPSGLTTLGSSAFYQCYSLQSVNIPSGVTSLPTNCFAYCYSLQSVNIPSGVTSLPNYCFQLCYSLQSVNIPSGVTSLGNSCFISCLGLSSINIPNSVTSIGSSCFSECYSLIKIYMESTTPPTLLSTNAIPNNTNLVIYVPSGSLTAYQSASNWSTFASKMKEL